MNRSQEVLRLRAEGLYFREIADRIGVSIGRVSQIYRSAVRRVVNGPDWHDGLGTRLVNISKLLNIRSRSDLESAYNDGRLNPRVTRGYSWGSHVAVAKWLGLPEPKKPGVKKRAPKLCPHCGGELK